MNIRKRKSENVSPVMIVNDEEKENMNVTRNKSEDISIAMTVNDKEESSENVIEFEFLPPEIQETIHRFLPAKDLFSMAKTSRYLLSVTKIQSLWTQLTLDWRDIYENDQFCKYLIKERYGKMRSVEITKRTKEKFYSINENEEFELKLTTLMDLILKSEALTSLKIDMKIPVSDSLLSKISEKISLTRIDLTGAWSKTKTLSPLCNLANLQSLKLYKMGHINSEEIDHLFSSMRNLKIVEVPNTTIQDNSIACLVKNNVKLNHLSINYCSSISSEGIEILAKACPSIQHVSMKKCEKLREVDALHLISSCPKLRHVGLSRIKDETLRKILEVCPEMESLSLEYAWVTAEGITELLTSAPRIVNLDFNEYTPHLAIGNFEEKFKKQHPASKVSIKFIRSDRPSEI